MKLGNRRPQPFPKYSFFFKQFFESSQLHNTLQLILNTLYTYFFALPIIQILSNSNPNFFFFFSIQIIHKIIHFFPSLHHSWRHPVVFSYWFFLLPFFPNIGGKNASSLKKRSHFFHTERNKAKKEREIKNISKQQNKTKLVQSAKKKTPRTTLKSR